MTTSGKNILGAICAGALTAAAVTFLIDKVRKKHYGTPDEYQEKPWEENPQETYSCRDTAEDYHRGCCDEFDDDIFDDLISPITDIDSEVEVNTVSDKDTAEDNATSDDLGDAIKILNESGDSDMIPDVTTNE